MTGQPDLTELQPLARIIAEKIHTVPVRHCPGGTDDLISALTLAVSIYVSRHGLPPGLPAAVVRPEPMSNERAAALLAPLEAKARALGEQRDAEHRAAVLREAAAAIQDFIDRDRARSAVRSNDRAALGAARQIVLDLIDGPSGVAADTRQDEGGGRDWGDLEDSARRERGMARGIVTALSRKAAASAGQWPPADETQPSMGETT